MHSTYLSLVIFIIIIIIIILSSSLQGVQTCTADLCVKIMNFLLFFFFFFHLSQFLYSFLPFVVFIHSKFNHGNDSVSNNFNTVIIDRNEIVNNDCHKCICSKKCKGLHGLKVH